MLKKAICATIVSAALLCSACSSSAPIQEKTRTESTSQATDEAKDSSVPDTSAIESESTLTESITESVAVEGDTQTTSIDETVLVDQDGIKITALRYDKNIKISDYSDKLSDGILMEIENNTDATLSVTLRHVYINNDIDVEGAFISMDSFGKIPASKKCRVYAHIDREGLSELGCDKVGQLDFVFQIYETEYYVSFDDLQVNTLYTSDRADEYPVFETDGKTLYQDEDIDLRALYWQRDEKGNYYFYLYAKNNLTDEIEIDSDTAVIGEYVVDAFEYRKLAAGKDSVFEIRINHYDLEMCDISEISEIAFSFKLQDKSYTTINELNDLHLAL